MFQLVQPNETTTAANRLCRENQQPQIVKAMKVNEPPGVSLKVMSSLSNP